MTAGGTAGEAAGWTIISPGEPASTLEAGTVAAGGTAGRTAGEPAGTVAAGEVGGAGKPLSALKAGKPLASEIEDQENRPPGLL